MIYLNRFSSDDFEKLSPGCNHIGKLASNQLINEVTFFNSKTDST